MPIYVYQCQSCSAVEEHIQRMSDAPITNCQVCGGPLRRSVTSAAFHLKGGGWYKDGYASNKDSGGSSAGGSDGGSGSSSSSSSDSGSGGSEKSAPAKDKSSSAGSSSSASASSS